MRTFILLLLITTTAAAQEHVLVKSGFGAAGYDLVSYFDNEPQKGDKAFQTEYQGVKYKFANQANLDSFKSNPDSYLPQYGGFCAYAMAVKGEKYGVNPKTYLITDGKLYLFYNKLGVNTKEKWEEEGPQELTVKADSFYQSLLQQ